MCPPKRLLIDVEERAHVRRGVGGAGGSAAPNDHDDADDEQAHERAAQAGGKRHDQRRCAAYHRPSTGIESHSVWATLCVSAWAWPWARHVEALRGTQANSSGSKGGIQGVLKVVNGVLNGTQG